MNIKIIKRCLICGSYPKLTISPSSLDDGMLILELECPHIYVLEPCFIYSQSSKHNKSEIVRAVSRWNNINEQNY